MSAVSFTKGERGVSLVRRECGGAGPPQRSQPLSLASLSPRGEGYSHQWNMSSYNKPNILFWTFCREFEVDILVVLQIIDKELLILYENIYFCTKPKDIVFLTDKNLKSATLHFGCRFAVKSYFWPLLCYDMRTRAIKNVFSVYKFPFPHQALKGLYAVCGPSM